MVLIYCDHDDPVRDKYPGEFDIKLVYAVETTQGPEGEYRVHLGPDKNYTPGNQLFGSTTIEQIGLFQNVSPALLKITQELAESMNSQPPSPNGEKVRLSDMLNDRNIKF